VTTIPTSIIYTYDSKKQKSNITSLFELERANRRHRQLLSFSFFVLKLWLMPFRVIGRNIFTET